MTKKWPLTFLSHQILDSMVASRGNVARSIERTFKDISDLTNLGLFFQDKNKHGDFPIEFDNICRREWSKWGVLGRGSHSSILRSKDVNLSVVEECERKEDWGERRQECKKSGVHRLGV